MPLVVTSPWYPDEALPFAGAFVSSAVRAVQPFVGDVTVVHTKEHQVHTGIDGVDSLRSRWLSETRIAMERAGRVDDPAAPGARLVRVPALCPTETTFAATARAHRDAFRTATAAHAPGAWFDAPVVHAHVGHLSGWAAATTVSPGTRLVLSEHYTKLPRVLRSVDGRALYQQAVHRADVVTVPGSFLANQISGAFPWLAERVVQIGNVVDVDAIDLRTTPVASLDRWLYLGRLLPHKRPLAVVDAFAVYRREHPDATLTLVGGGGEEDALQARAAELGLEASVAVLGALPPEEVPALLARHDVLVHLSSIETFGITIAEALASGMPVVVTRCGGPEDILAGVPTDSARLVEVSASAEDVAATVHDLAATLGSRDPAAARRSVADRYSPDAVGRRLVALYAGDPLPTGGLA